MKKIRVLVVDDSFFMRKLLRDLIIKDVQIEVVGQAKDGFQAIAEAARLKPDVITMDYNMPGMNGDEAIVKILKGTDPLPAIIMISAHTRTGAEETLRSLRAGAVDFILKNSGELSLNIDKKKEEIIDKIKLAAEARVIRHKKLKIDKSKKNKESKEAAGKIVVIGASTGGPPVVENILSAFPAKFDFSILIVQHMPKGFTERFAERLNRISKFLVREAKEGDKIKNGMALVAPGGFHVQIKRSKDKDSSDRFIHLNEDSPQNGLRPSIDVLMNSVAHIYADNVIGIILTGMGCDGKEGMRAIKTVYGKTLVQSPETAVISSMPNSVIEAGLSDEILSPEKIADRVMKMISLK